MEENFTPKQEASAFPLGVFPKPLQHIMSELNRCCGFPVDYTASAMLAAISIGIGNTCRIEVKRNWHESAIIYLAIVGRPGAMKSHPLNFVMQPFVDADWRANQEYQRQYADYQRAVGMTKKERIEAGFEAYPVEPKRHRFLVSDVTQEGLSAIHAHNPRGIGLWMDELSAWFKNFTRYNNGSEEQFWLSAFNGNTTMADRKSSQNSIFIKRPFITVVGTIQKTLLTDLASGERGSNGFVDRILFAISNDRAKPRWSDDEADGQISDEWATVLGKLLGISANMDGEGDIVPNVVTLTPNARELLFRWQHLNAEQCDKELSDTIVSFFCKLEIYAIRFCLLLRMARWACSDHGCLPDCIEAEDVEGAIKLTEYYRANALSVLTCIHEEKLNDLHRTIYEHLPNEFTTSEGILIAERFGMKPPTFKMFLSRARCSLFKRMKQGVYRKVSCYFADNVTLSDNPRIHANEE